MKTSLHILTLLLICTSLPLYALEPIFVPLKIDGPAQDPVNNTFWYGPFCEGCAVLDVNGDGHLDITCGVNWYEGPNWTKHANYRGNADIMGEFVNDNGEYPVDVDRDGKMDLISSGWLTNGVFWYRNPGDDKTEWEPTKILSSDQTEGLMVEDIDGDGDSDVLVNHWGPKEGQGVTWLELLDEPKFAIHVIGTEGDHHGGGIGDINSDGRKDIITPHGWYEAPEHPAKDEWTFHADYHLDDKAEPGIRMPVIDVNGDGLNDIIYGYGHGYGMGWLEQTRGKDGARGFKDHQVEDSLSQLHTSILGDVNQDGNLDLIIGKRLRGHSGADPSSFDPLGVFWYEIKDGQFKRHVLSYNHLPWYPGMETINPPPNYAIGAGMNLVCADVTEDGKVDIVCGGKSGLYLFVNRGLPPTAPMVK
ncbi:MAG: VCBS repeat-containing protein [Candidatus Omnitrophica bacterium]|nr:VCBS repeat-containing protein [Candidatus Omnitrophota bacterium]